MTNPFEDPEWLAYAERVIDKLVPMIRDSAINVSLVPTGGADVKFATELGLSIMMDKPIIAVVPPGTKVPANLVKVAVEIIEGDVHEASTQRRLRQALKKYLEEK